jgi:hypothetical protein
MSEGVNPYREIDSEENLEKSYTKSEASKDEEVNEECKSHQADSVKQYTA